MKGKLGNFLDAVRASYWLIPALMTLAAAILSFSLIAFDQFLVEQEVATKAWLYSGGPAGAREVLSAISSSMITVTGVVFSVTIVAFTLASQQFGPRILRNFVRDRSSQAVLGTFIATYIYCLITLRSIRSNDTDNFVPELALTVTFILAVCSVAVLIFFIHHVSTSISITAIVTGVGKELQKSVDRLIPAEQEQPQGDAKSLPQEEAAIHKSNKYGYIQVIGKEKLLQLASKHDLVMKIICPPGEFVTEGADLISIWPRDRYEKVEKKLASTVLIGKERTPTQDICTTVNQLVQVAVRALSPGINDPRTAITCIHALTAPLWKVAERTPPPDEHYDKDGQLRVVVPKQTFAEIATSIFDQIRPYAKTNPTVIFELLKMISVTAKHVIRAEDRELLHAEAVAIYETFLASSPQLRDRHHIQAEYDKALKTLRA